MQQLYSIGYATKPIDVFIEQLHHYNITAVADIRSVPYSNAFFDYHHDPLRNTLKSVGIRYVYLGDELGPRSKNPAHYENKQVQYDRLSQSDVFIAGVERLKTGLSKGWEIALMCAEKDPADCHRSWLLGESLKQYQIQLNHILHDGEIETHASLEERLIHQHGLDVDLFSEHHEKVALAHETQCRLKAYKHP